MSHPIRILELRSVRGTGGGPEKTILQGAARTDPERFAVTVCYLRDARDTVFGIDQRAASLPVDYVEIRERHSFDPRVFGALRRIIRERRIDIVHAHEYKTDLLAWGLARVEPIVPLATAHGWTGDSRRERLLYYPADKRLLARFPAVVAVSSEIKTELIRHGASADRVITLLNGIDPERFRRDRGREAGARETAGVSASDIVVGAAGRLERQKRFDLLIDAIASVRQRGIPVTLLIAGDGSQRHLLEQQIRQLGAEAYCRLLGHCSDVTALHHACDLFVQSSDYEGTPNAVLEAMALETAVIATNVGGTSELLRDGVDGVVIAPGDVAALVAAIEAAIADPSTRHMRVESARRRIETTLSFEARMTALEAVYVRLLAGAGGAGAQPMLQPRGNQLQG